MKASHAPLSPHEENTLRRIGFHSGEGLTVYLRRLLHLELVEWSGWTWRLTALGRRRYEGLVFDASATSWRPAA